MRSHRMEAVARRKLGLGNDWRGRKFEVLDDGSGGTVIWLKRQTAGGYEPDTKVTVVFEAETTAEEVHFEAETGKCSDCEGEGKTIIGWSADTGRRTGPCKRCGGTGMP